MPPGSVYYIFPVPDEHQQAVLAITNTICQEDGIDSAFPLLTDAEVPQEQVINASNLPEIAEWLTTSFSVSLEIGVLESLVSQFSNVLIIPLWIINLEGAILGDRGAAYHLVEPLVERESVNKYLPVEHFQERAAQTGVTAEQARLNVLADAMLEVVKHADQRMFLRSVKDSQLLRDPDRRPVIFTPNGIEEYTLWRWAESEAVKKAEALLYECPYQPELTIEAIPRDGEPICLSLPFSGESLVLPRGPGGRPAGDVFGGVEGFLSRIGSAIVALRAQGKRPTIEAVAELANLSRDQVTRGRRHYGFEDWNSVVQTVIHQKNDK